MAGQELKTGQRIGDWLLGRKQREESRKSREALEAGGDEKAPTNPCGFPLLMLYFEHTAGLFDL